MQKVMLFRAAIAAVLAVSSSGALAQVVGPRGPNNPSAPDSAPASTATIQCEAPIASVTVYQGRAAVTRSAELTLEQGLYAIRFGNLPVAIQPDTLQAKVGDTARLVNVEYLETPVVEDAGSPAMVAITQQIEESKRVLARLGEDRAALVAQSKIVDQIGVRSAADASRDAGTDRLSIDALRKQLEFVQSERARLLDADRGLVEKSRDLERRLESLEARRAAMGRTDRIDRSAEVTIAVPQAGKVPISLTYLVANAGWEPTYSVRAAGDRSSVSLEFDANLLQRSGEDWNDVALTISTAQPTVRANPPAITPIFVSVVVPPPPPPMPAVESPAPGASLGMARRRNGMNEESDRAGDGGAGGDDRQSAEDAKRAQLGKELESWSAGAAVVEGGTAVSYELPRRVTVASNADRKTRTRVATITPTATFVYTAIPLLTDAVYLRSRMVNDSAYQLVPGPAQVFMGSEYVGPTRIGGVPPKGDFTVYFGIDRAIRAVRTLVSKNTSESGVFSKSRETVWNYRIVIDNGSGRDIDLELWDRRPVSQDEKITVTVDGLSRPLSTDAEFVRDQLPQGIMRWDLRVPATSTGINATAITWTTKISAARDLKITPVPD